MKLTDFDYRYPKELIAQRPLPDRDASRMMIVDRGAKRWTHATAANLPDVLKSGDLLIINNSEVVPARLFGTRPSGAPIELLVVEPADGTSARTWRCLAKKAKRVRTGERIFFGQTAQATVSGREGIHLLVDFEPGQLERAIQRRGAPPLPPYIEREGFDAYTDEDRKRYQTVYASMPGSAAAPTAGLHLSERLLEMIGNRGIEIVPITLHIGIDTFRPVSAERTRDHKMHGERFEIPQEAAESIDRAKHEKRRIVACGTTTVRALESSWEAGRMTPASRTTNLFITPGYDFRVVDAMLTNFHQPKSTLLMMVAAFAGKEFILSCYEEAIRERYRLFSYGDCMLIL